MNLNFSPVAFLITISIIGATITASVIYHYQRETTSIEDKCINHSGAKIDADYHQSYLSDPPLIVEDEYYSDNIVRDNEVYGPSISLYAGSDNDWDEDGWTNNRELTENTNPENPDTDGDGIVDSQDAEPNDPNIGGTSSPAVLPPPISHETGGLIIKDFYKNVRNVSQGDIEWSNYIDTKPNDILKFFIYIDLENTNSIPEAATLYDILEEPNLEYDDSLQIIINGIEQPHSDLLEHTWRDGYHITVAPETTKTYKIYFRSITRLNQPNRITAATNIAKLVTDYDTLMDVAFVGINSF